MTEFKQMLPEIVNILNSFREQGLIKGYALIGGMAVATRGFPRATKDIDFFIAADEGYFRKEVAKKLETKGYSVEIYKGDFNDPLRGLIRILDKDNTSLIDLILAHREWQEEIINFAEEIILGDISVPIARAEDLVVLKLKAGSPRDLLDAEELVKIISFSGRLDKSRLLSLAKKAKVDKKLEQLLFSLHLDIDKLK